MWYKLKRILIYPDGVTEKQVYPKTRNPWANTLLYCPLKEDYADHSPTPKTITLNWTVTQDTIWYNFNWWYLVSSAFTWPTTHTTMSIWAKPNGIRSNYQALFSKYYGSFTYPYATTSIWITDNTSNADFSIANSSATLRNTLASLTMWSRQLITWTYDGSNVKIYINWQLISSTAESGSMLSNNTQASIGNYLWTTQLFYWNLSEVILEDKSRTADEITNYYNQTKFNYWL